LPDISKVLSATIKSKERSHGKAERERQGA
jgi:hypothetical protein